MLLIMKLPFIMPFYYEFYVDVYVIEVEPTEL